jgi:hypothetical protein
MASESEGLTFARESDTSDLTGGELFVYRPRIEIIRDMEKIEKENGDRNPDALLPRLRDKLKKLRSLW